MSAFGGKSTLMRGPMPARKIIMDFDMLGLAPRLVAKLKEQGILTDEEFTQKKTELLAKL